MGLGQTWQNVTASRVAGVTYTNTTGKPIMLCVIANFTTAGGNFSITVSENPIVESTINGDGAAKSTNTVIVPNNSTYSYTATYSVSAVFELR